MLSIAAYTSLLRITTTPPEKDEHRESASIEDHVPPVPVPAVAHTPAGSDVDMLTPGAGAGDLDASDGEEDDGLFAGGDEEEEESADEPMEDVTAAGAANGMKRKLVEEEDYD